MAVALGSLAILVGMAAAGGTLWLRSDRGHRFVAERAVGWFDAHMKGRITVERVEGRVLGGVRFVGLVLRDPKGRVVGRCRAVEAHYGLFDLIRNGSVARLDVEGADIQLKAFTDGRLGLEPLLEEFKKGERLEIRRFEFHDANIVLDGLAGPFEALHHLNASTSLAMRDHGDRGTFEVRSLDGKVRMEKGPERGAHVEGRFDYDPKMPLSLRDLKVAIGDSALAGRARLTAGHIDVDITRLHVSARDFHQAVPLENPPADIDGTASLHGRRDAAGIRIHLRPGQGRIALTGTVDLQHLKLSAHIVHEKLDGAFFPTRPPFILSAVLDATIRKSSKGVVGDTELTMGHGVVRNIVFDRAHVNANWIGDGIHFGRVSLDVPGATVTGSGTIHFGGDITMQSHADISGLSKFIGLVRGKVEMPGQPKERGIAGATVTIEKQKNQDVKTKVSGIKIAPKIERDAGGNPK